MNSITEMSMSQLQERLASVTRVHTVLNVRRELMPISQEREALWFVAGSVGVLLLMGLAAVL